MNITWLNILTQKKKTSLFTYKRGRGFELGSTDKRLQLSGESGTWTRDFRITSPAL